MLATHTHTHTRAYTHTHTHPPYKTNKPKLKECPKSEQRRGAVADPGWCEDTPVSGARTRTVAKVGASGRDEDARGMCGLPALV